ncbi:MAG TPA: aquaporin [Candidatus Saccharimonadales bacterium]|nr:aquaporin [Candidatus Saccharimonadales bacterium]
MFGRRHAAQLLAEFLGTAVLSMAVYTIIARTSFPLFSGMAAGGVLALWIMSVGAISGSHINPAVTFGLWTTRKIGTLKAITYIAAQMLGGLAAWQLMNYYLGRDLTSLVTGGFEWKIFVAEAVGAGIFTFGVASSVFQKAENSKKAAIQGFSLFVGVLAASLASNALLNPAVAVGVQSWSWTYAVAPLAGALVGMNLYAYVFDPALTGGKASAAVSSSSSAKKPVSKAKKTTRKKK